MKSMCSSQIKKEEIQVATNTASSRGAGGEDPRVKSAVRGAFFGFYVDLFDIFLPVVALAPALIYFISAEIPTATAGLLGAFIFASTLLGRPLGALIFGVLADRIGRRRTTIICIAGFTVGTGLITVLPGYQQIGIAAVIIFIFLRFVDGVFLGGEYSAANPLAMEYSPREKRGYYGGLIIAAFPLAFATISLLTLFLLLVMSSEGLNSAYVQWGWRIPFVIGTLMSLGLLIYYIRYVSESEIWTAAQEASADAGESAASPLVVLFSGESLKAFLQVFVLMTGIWFINLVNFAIVPGLLSSAVGLSYINATITLVIASVVTAGAYWGAGTISQYTGRRMFMMIMAILTIMVAAPILYVLLNSTPQSVVVVTLMVTGVFVMSASVMGVAPTYINERFHTGVRASAYGLGYSLAAIIPSFYAVYQSGLSTFMPSQYTAIVLFGLGAIFAFVGAVWGPETKDVDFHEDVGPSETATASKTQRSGASSA